MLGWVIDGDVDAVGFGCLVGVGWVIILPASVGRGVGSIGGVNSMLETYCLFSFIS